MAGPIQGVMTPTLGLNAVQPFSYQGGVTGTSMSLNLGFIPSAILAFHATQSWCWVKGSPQGLVFAISTASWGTANLNSVVDVLDGSGVATAGVATTTVALGVVLGSSSVVSAGGNYFGLAFR